MSRTIKIKIAKEEDRETMAGILAKNGYGVKCAKDYKTTRDGKQGKAMEYFLVIEGTEDAQWNRHT